MCILIISQHIIASIACTKGRGRGGIRKKTPNRWKEGAVGGRERIGLGNKSIV